MAFGGQFGGFGWQSGTPRNEFNTAYQSAVNTAGTAGFNMRSALGIGDATQSDSTKQTAYNTLLNLSDQGTAGVRSFLDSRRNDILGGYETARTQDPTDQLKFADFLRNLDLLGGWKNASAAETGRSLA
jgi:hypothetical protein